uniref:DUF1835 domain-containing protein n=1 Tax=Magnetococcus massalia (strain MO-1) TaxID=451514 RepID=A0A1S7LI02_MAGMO|nr:Conserved protein of unknown function [Candidatus Magnetococcus massalia]
MSIQLHISNGDSATGLMQAAGIAGQLLPWRDLLHDGPVPAVESLQALSQIRAEFIHSCGWGDIHDLEVGFQERDNTLVRWHEHGEVVLWFEHDLYDQLQLLQILAWFAQLPAAQREQAQSRLFLIQSDDYLGECSPMEMVNLEKTKQPVSSAQLELAKQAWEAFTQPEPTAWQALLNADTSALPWLAASVKRQLMQFPSTKSGLSYTQQLIVEMIAEGIDNPGWLFHHYLERDTPKFMGDASFWQILRALTQGASPLIAVSTGAAFEPPVSYPPDEAFAAQQLSLTADGEAVLAGEADWVSLNGIDHWSGGCHLTIDNLWRWDGEKLAQITSVRLRVE